MERIPKQCLHWGPGRYGGYIVVVAAPSPPHRRPSPPFDCTTYIIRNWSWLSVWWPWCRCVA
eukprot:3502501-Pyramimonas_sp.AAC.1